MQHMTEDQRRRIGQLAKRHPMTEIARRLGISQSRVYRYCKREGIVAASAKRKLPEDVEEIRALLDRLGSVEAVAQKFRCSRQAVYRRLADA